MIHDPRATPAQIARRLEFMAATLPYRGVSDESGELRATVYATLLSNHTDAALSYMCRRACAELDWFPTPKQCLSILADYREDESPQSYALRLCRDYDQSAFERWIGNVGDGQDVGDVPEHWQRIAVERGVMRRLDDGAMVSRPQYHGPVKPYVPAPERMASVAA